MVSTKRLALILILLWGILFAQESADSLGWKASSGTLSDTLYVIDAPILQAEQAPLPIDPISKDAILDWIDQDRAYSSFDFLPFKFNLQGRFYNLYRLGANSTGRNSASFPVSVLGYQIPNSIFSQAHYLGYLGQYFTMDSASGGIKASHQKYSLPITLSSIKGSLGDYDNRFAKGNLAKGELFGIQNLNIEMGLNLINGYWLDMPISQSSNREYLSYRYRNTEFTFINASYQADASMYELLPIYWQSTNYRLKHKYTLQMLAVQYPLIELSVLKTNESTNSSVFTKELTSDSVQFAALRKFRWAYLDADLRYEYTDVERNHVTSSSYKHPDYHNHLSISLLSTGFITQNLEANTMDWKLGNIRYAASKTFQQLSVGTYGFSTLGKHNPVLIVTSPTGPISMAAVDIQEKYNYGLSLGYSVQALQLQTFLGQKYIVQETPLKKVEKKLNHVGVNTSWNPRMQDWELLLQSTWEYQSYNELLMENPEFSYLLGAGLTRHLEHDNAISAGFTVGGHSVYYAANEANPILLDGSTMLDLYSGVKIGRLFDFQVSAKNVLDSSSFGVYPVPPSIHASIRWYFIN